jgi:hypothetical protein
MASEGGVVQIQRIHELGKVIREGVVIVTFAGLAAPSLPRLAIQVQLCRRSLA